MELPKLNHKKAFTKKLLEWDAYDNHRQMPWKGEKDPYKVWISEIILQQTRVEQGLKYYHRFIAAFPDISSLASAPEKKVFKLWQGLGYYTRCRNIIYTAQYIQNSLDGKFPDDYASILKLKGIGSYTASAIASFVYQLPHAVVDGNVYRVLSRYFGIETPTDSLQGKKMYALVAEELMDKSKPGIYNQAIMDFGATVCKPASPACIACPLKKYCSAYYYNMVHSLPVKSKKLKNRVRHFSYIVFNYGKKYYLRKRDEKDIWRGLYEFFLVETGRAVASEEVLASATFRDTIGENHYEVVDVSDEFSQQLTHQTIRGRFIRIRIQAPLPQEYSLKLYGKKQIEGLPFPKFISSYLED